MARQLPGVPPRALRPALKKISACALQPGGDRPPGLGGVLADRRRGPLTLPPTFVQGRNFRLRGLPADHRHLPAA
ncbi:hypothetical protein ACU4GD_30940 [Cupriavidus basilensis]